MPLQQRKQNEPDLKDRARLLCLLLLKYYKQLVVKVFADDGD